MAFSSREETGSAKWIRTTIKRINSALPCRVGHRGIVVAPPLLRSRPPRARDELGAARRSSLDLKLVDPLGLEPRPDGLRDRCAAVTPRVNAGKGGGSCIPIIGFGDRGSAVELRPYETGTSLMNRTSLVAVRSRNAGSTGRGVMLCGALPTESNLVFSRLQGERRRIWLEGRIRQQPVSEHKRLTNVSLATGDRHARTHTCHRWPVCCCYPVVKELRTRRRCAGPPFKLEQTKRPGCLRDPGLGHSTEAALTR